MQKYILALPLVCESEGAAILSRIVVPVRWKWRIVPVMAMPCIAYVLIYRITVSVEFPHPGDGHRSPSGRVIIHSIEILRTGFHAFIPFEIPGTVQHEFKSVSREIRRHRNPVPLYDLRILPIRKFGYLRCIH